MTQNQRIGLVVLFFGISSLGAYTVVENYPLSEKNRVEHIENVELEFARYSEIIPENSIARRDICGSDDRVSSNDPAVGRIRFGASGVPCTGWISETGLIVTAGHCVYGSAGTKGIENDGIVNTIEFNTKPSLSNGTMVDSDPEHVYVIDESSIDGYKDQSGGHSEDWGVFRVFDNEITGMQPIAAQSSFYTTVIPNSGNLNTTLTVTGYGDSANEERFTQKKASETGVFNVSTTILYSVDTESSNSGSPIIAVINGQNVAIGVHTNGGCPNFGTTFRETDFWDAVHPSGTFTTQLNQKRDGGAQYTGSQIGVWENNTFSNKPISGTLPSVTSDYGEIEVFRGAQSLVTSPYEKFNRWNSNNTGDLTDVTNHKKFPIYENSTVTSQLKKVYNATVKNYYPEFPSLNPTSDQVFVKDPWLIDYADPDYGNNTRSQGMLAPFKAVSSGATNNLGTATSHKGVFLDESGPNEFWAAPYYSVKAPEEVNFGGTLGTRKVQLIDWESADADFEYNGRMETAVTFTTADAEVRANLKYLKPPTTQVRSKQTKER